MTSRVRDGDVTLGGLHVPGLLLTPVEA
ncbi:hypothetical protein E2C01_093529 [Portunus trituberculatus]|uniref:Uncharacterized protein n=1 Tax=Portunus trituberculatus TaxID=210409 RepID=A0A5B7JUF7_PORTR|nr:hypothetical protein [Portunus trituberculatus]